MKDKPREPRTTIPRGMEEVFEALHTLEKNDVRLAEDATEEQRLLVRRAREAIAEVMVRPSRWSQMRLHAAAMIIDEVCGKLSEKVDLKAETTVEVVINQSEKKEPL